MKKENETCCSCKTMLKSEVRKMVDEVEGYTTADHARKQREVKAAFDPGATHRGSEKKKCVK